MAGQDLTSFFFVKKDIWNLCESNLCWHLKGVLLHKFVLKSTFPSLFTIYLYIVYIIINQAAQIKVAFLPELAGYIHRCMYIIKVYASQGMY